MKRLFLLGLSLSVALLSVSCWKDYEAESDGLTTFSLTPSIPDDNLSNVDPEIYDLRYTLEIRTTDAPSQLVYRRSKYINENFHSDRVIFTAKLEPRNYHFMIWADYVRQDDTEHDLHYKTDNDGGLRQITMMGEYAVSDPSRDAYFWCGKDIDMSSGGKSSPQLSSPFAKIRFVDPQGTNVPASVEMACDRVPGGFDVLAGEPLETSAATPADRTSIPVTGEAYVVPTEYIGAVTYKDASTLVSDYLFAGTDPVSCRLTLTSNLSDGTRYETEYDMQIVKDKLFTYLGVFSSLEEAREARCLMTDAYASKNAKPLVKQVADVEALMANIPDCACLRLTAPVSASAQIVLPAYAAAPNNIYLDFRAGIDPAATVAIDAETNSYAGSVHVIATDTQAMALFSFRKSKNTKIIFYDADDLVIEDDGSVEGGHTDAPPSGYEPEL